MKTRTPAPTVWVTGAGGLIGSWLVRVAPEQAPAWSVRGLTRGDLDLSDLAALDRLFREERPDLVIHCAAVSRSTECESNPALARRVNLEATARLAALCSLIPFIYFSSDLVFDGRKGNYDESAPVNPLSVYGETKAAAEAVVLTNHGHSVIRTSLNGGQSPTGDRGFNEQMRRSWQADQTLHLFADEFRCPIAVQITARAVWELVAAKRPGLYHLCGAERLSRWSIGQLLARRWPGLNPRIESASLKDYAGPTRPPDVSMNCEKIQRLLSFPLPRFSDWLAGHPNEVF